MVEYSLTSLETNNILPLSKTLIKSMAKKRTKSTKRRSSKKRTKSTKRRSSKKRTKSTKRCSSKKRTKSTKRHSTKKQTKSTKRRSSKKQTKSTKKQSGGYDSIMLTKSLSNIINHPDIKKALGNVTHSVIDSVSKEYDVHPELVNALHKGINNHSYFS